MFECVLKKKKEGMVSCLAMPRWMDYLPEESSSL